MSRTVPHLRPEPGYAGVLSGAPVSATDWAGYGLLANWINGHGAQLIPWTALLRTVAGGATEVFNLRVRPSTRTVQRIWRLNIRSGTEGATATITCGSAAAVTVSPATTIAGRREAITIVENLSAKATDATANVTLTVQATGGAMTVEAVACYEQTRATLDASTDDYGVDITTLRARQPIADFAYQSVAGVIDAYKNLDARRSAYFDWAIPTAVGISPGSTSLTDVFPLYPVVYPPVALTGTTETDVTVAAFAKVSGGTGTVQFDSTAAASSAALSITSTSYAWVTGTVTCSAEDLSTADNRRGAAWETVRIRAADPAAQTLSIAGLKIYRTPVPL
jgi:hypothetical protein